MPEAIWGAYPLDTFVAPHLSEFTSALIPDMSRTDAQQEHWSANYLLNTVLSSRLPAPHRQQVTNAIRHTQSAFTSYGLAREATLGFLSAPARPMVYLRALGHWEDFLARSWRAFTFFDRGRKAVFSKGDGSVIERLCLLDARVRHAAAAIERAGADEDAPTVTVWLENDGLHSAEHALTFNECSEVLRDLARLASAMENPAAMREELERLVAESEATDPR